MRASVLAPVTLVSPLARALRSRTANPMSGTSKVTSARTLHRAVCSPKTRAAYTFEFVGADTVSAALAPVTNGRASFAAVTWVVQIVRTQQHAKGSEMCCCQQLEVVREDVA
jgi:hypothetical protein